MPQEKHASSRHLLFRISLLLRKRKIEGRGRSQSPPLSGLELWGCPNTTLPEKVALRPSMSEFRLVLCGVFLDLFRITENTSQESVKCVVWQSANTLLTLLSPTTPGGRNTLRLMHIEEDIRIRSSRVTRKQKRSKDLKRTSREEKHGA